MKDHIEFSEATKEVFKAAQENAILIGNNTVGSDNLLLGIVDNPTIQTLLKNSGTNPTLIRITAYRETIINAYMPSVSEQIRFLREPNLQLDYTPRTKQIITDAVETVRRQKKHLIEPSHLLESILTIQEGLCYSILVKSGLDKEAMLEKLRTS